MMYRAGHVAVSTTDIVEFLLTPIGLAYAALLSSVALAINFLEQAGIMLLAARVGTGERPNVPLLLRALLRKAIGILELGVISAGLLALAVVPFPLLAVLVKSLLLSGHDIYFYITVRPPVFWVVAGIGGVLLLGALALAAFIQVRLVLALPILLFENLKPRAALRASRERVRGLSWRVGTILIGWTIGTVLLGIGVEIGFRQIAALILANAGERPVIVILILLLAQGALLAMGFFVLIVGLGLIARRVYLVRSEQLGIAVPGGWDESLRTDRAISPSSWRLALLTLPLFMLVPLALWADMARYLSNRPPVQVTAHRGHARLAPENTLSAMQKAIESGADYVEFDAQLTSDGKVVLLHDRDLMRVAGLSRRLEDMTYDEVRQLDVGSWFDQSFADERVPTLQEVIDLCRGKVRLNIELKVFGPNPRLSEAVARIVRDNDFEGECLITALSYDSLQEAKQANPRLKTGLTIAHALGDVNRLAVDAISVRAEFLSPELLRSAQRQGRQVHVWNINEAGPMVRMIKRGVDNIITSDPNLAIRSRDDWAALSGPERLILASRLLLGLNP